MFQYSPEKNTRQTQIERQSKDVWLVLLTTVRATKNKKSLKTRLSQEVPEAMSYAIPGEILEQRKGISGKTGETWIKSGV